MSQTFNAGTKAYIDSFRGLVPCTVLAVNKPCNGRRIGDEDELTVRVDQAMAGYSEGETVNCTAAYTPPRICCFLQGHLYRIRTDYAYVPAD